MKNAMNAEQLKQRTKAFSLRVVRFASSLPKDRVSDIFARQLVRCGTSIAANYRAACLARSRAEFAAKIGIVQEEADKTLFWFEMAEEAGLVQGHLVKDLLAEGGGILAIIIASRKTAKSKRPRKTT